MRLEDGDQPPRPELAQRLERRRDLGRVVGVVVVDRGARAAALALEAAQHPGERAERGRGRARASAPASSSAASAARALRTLWRPGTAQLQRPGPGRVGVEAQRPRRRRRRRPSRSSPGEHRQAPARRPRTRRRRSSSSARDDQREWWSSSTLVTTATSGAGEEAAVGLVGLGDHPLPRRPSRRSPAPPSSPAPGQLAAEQEAGVGADRAQRVDQHPGGGRLAVRAGDRDQPPLGAQLGEQLAAVEHPLAALAGARELGVVLGDRGRDHHLGVRRDGSASWPTRARGRRPAAARGRSSSARSEPVTSAPSRWQTSARPLIPAPPMAMKWSLRPLQSSFIATLVVRRSRRAPPPRSARRRPGGRAGGGGRHRLQARRIARAGPPRSAQRRAGRARSPRSRAPRPPSRHPGRVGVLVARRSRADRGPGSPACPRPRARTPSRRRGRARGRRRPACRRGSARTRAACSGPGRRRPRQPLARGRVVAVAGDLDHVVVARRSRRRAERRRRARTRLIERAPWLPPKTSRQRSSGSDPEALPRRVAVGREDRRRDRPAR